MDADLLLTERNRHPGLRILARPSTNYQLVELDSATGSYSRIASVDMFSFGQYLLAPGIEVRASMLYNERLPN